MTDASASPQPFEATITITVSDQAIKYDSELALPEVVFWLDALKTIILQDLISTRGGLLQS